MLLYRLIIFVYSLKNISLKKTKKEKFLFKDINNNIITKKVIYNNVYGNNIFLNLKKEFDESDNNNGKVINLLKNGEQNFIDFEAISFYFLIFGFFIIIYGGYYYQLALIIHFNLFLYYILILIVPESSRKDDRIYKFILLFSFLSGFIIYAIINTNNKLSRKFFILKIIYGFICGCFLHKIIFYYIYFYTVDIDDKKFDDIYCCFFVSFILIFGAISCFIPDDYVFFSCSTISGSFYIIKFLDCIIVNKDENKKEIDITNIIIQIIVIIFSIFLQIYHKINKDSENPNNYIEEKIETDSARISMASNTSNSNSQNIEIKQDVEEKQQLLIEQKSNEGEVEEEEINDQED